MLVPQKPDSEKIKMKNLAGVKEADDYIRGELETAGIQIIKGPLTNSEVPYTLIGQLGDWTFNRAWYYWMTNSSERKTGLPLDIAEKLHDKKYRIKGPKEPETYGRVIRVAGHCGCPPPKEWAYPTKEVLDSQSKIIGIDWRRTNYGALSELCNSGKIQGERFVDNYHIDTQEGLDEFARVIMNISQSGVSK